MEKYSKDNIIYNKYLPIIFLTIVLLFSINLFAQAQVKEGVGDWFIRTEEDPMTDEKEMYFILADEKSLETFDRMIMKSIVIRKIPDSSPELIIEWSDYLADNNSIRWRLDKGDINKDNWTSSEGGEALFFPDYRKDLVEFVEQLIKSEKIAIELKPYNQKAEAAVFNLSGLGENLKPHLEYLGWEELKSIINK